MTSEQGAFPWRYILRTTLNGFRHDNRTSPGALKSNP
jgi:hypothetical protein